MEKKRKRHSSDSSSDNVDERLEALCTKKDDEKKLIQFVNIARLLPINLLQIEVCIGNNKSHALLNTGSENNLMKR